jgi:hypothetical protein
MEQGQIKAFVEAVGQRPDWLADDLFLLHFTVQGDKAGDVSVGGWSGCNNHHTSVASKIVYEVRLSRQHGP